MTCCHRRGGDCALCGVEDDEYDWIEMKEDCTCKKTKTERGSWLNRKEEFAE